MDEGVVISVQPQAAGAWRPFLVDTGGWASTGGVQLIPETGLDLLRLVHELHVEEAVSLQPEEGPEPARRYKVRVPDGETLFEVRESSSESARLAYGSSRPLQLVVYDPGKRPIITVERRLACSTCLCFCRLQSAEVRDDRQTLGRVEQRWSPVFASFSITDAAGAGLLRLEGPSHCLCCMPAHASFRVLLANGDQVGSIIHRWDAGAATYKTIASVPDRRLGMREKALVLAAAFLLDYTYFGRARKRPTFRMAI